MIKPIESHKSTSLKKNCQIEIKSTKDNKISNYINLPYVNSEKITKITSKKISMVYILELENNKFYIGLSTDINNRLYRHFNGYGSVWTKLHKPIKLVECIIGDSLVEKSKTLEYMSNYGWQNVRGYTWCTENMKLPPKQLRDNC